MQGFIGLKGYKEFGSQKPAAWLGFPADLLSRARTPTSPAAATREMAYK